MSPNQPFACYFFNIQHHNGGKIWKQSKNEKLCEDVLFRYLMQDPQISMLEMYLIIIAQLVQAHIGQ